MAIASDYCINYSQKKISHIDGALNWDTGSGTQPIACDFIRNTTTGAVARVLVALTGTSGTDNVSCVLPGTTGVFDNNDALVRLESVNFDTVANCGFSVGDTVTGTTSTVSSNQATPIPDPITYPLNNQLSPLLNNLVRIFHFSNATKKWSFYDPKSELAPFVTLTELAKGEAYWIKVKQAQATVISGTYRDLFEGWNLVAW